MVRKSEADNLRLVFRTVFNFGVLTRTNFKKCRITGMWIMSYKSTVFAKLTGGQGPGFIWNEAHKQGILWEQSQSWNGRVGADELSMSGCFKCCPKTGCCLFSELWNQQHSQRDLLLSQSTLTLFPQGAWCTLHDTHLRHVTFWRMEGYSATVANLVGSAVATWEQRCCWTLQISSS